MSERRRIGFRALCALAGVAVLLLAVSGILLSTSQPAKAGGEGAELAAVRAPAEIGNAGSWREARVGDRLLPGEMVRTGWGGLVELVLGESRVTLHENSSFRLPAEAPPRDTRAVHLDAGTALFDVLLGGAVRRFEVRTPEAVAAVRGTRFALRADAHNVALRVFEGSVALASERWPELLVEAGLGAVGGDEAPFVLAPADELGLQDLDPWRADGRIREGEARPPRPKVDVQALRDGAWRAAIDTLAENAGSGEGRDGLEANTEGVGEASRREVDGEAEAVETDVLAGPASFDDRSFDGADFEEEDFREGDFHEEFRNDDFDDDGSTRGVSGK